LLLPEARSCSSSRMGLSPAMTSMCKSKSCRSKSRYSVPSWRK
jgi:hypothetical protein